MVDAFTNRGLVLQVTGSNVDTWGDELNVSDITITDSILGATLSYALSAGTSNLTQTQSQNLAITLTGALAGDAILTLPLNFNSATVAIGGTFVFNNQTTNAHTVTVKTVAAGSTGVAIPQGLRAILYSDGTNVYSANDGGKGSAFSVNTYAGNPDGVVTCIPGSATTPADMLYDRTNNILYACTAAPNTWTQVTPISSAASASATGYLTLSSDANNVVLTNDAAAATSVYYTPYTGSLVSIPDGSTYTAYTFSQLTLALSATLQAASGIYDAFAFVNSGNAAIGFGPIWTAGGGSVTAGFCARGTGAASTQIERLGGLWTNSVSITLNNGATTYSVGVKSATYLGSVFIDATAGQVTCHVSAGQARKWGVWNAYNRLPISLTERDPSSATPYSGTWRQFNADATNYINVFSGLAEENFDLQFLDYCSGSGVPDDFLGLNGIGINSVVPVGRTGINSITGANNAGDMVAIYTLPPRLGINQILPLQNGETGTPTFAGGAFYALTANWQG